jgi:hypothetical protein
MYTDKVYGTKEKCKQDWNMWRMKLIASLWWFPNNQLIKIWLSTTTQVSADARHLPMCEVLTHISLLNNWGKQIYAKCTMNVLNNHHHVIHILISTVSLWHLQRKDKFFEHLWLLISQGSINSVYKRGISEAICMLLAKATGTQNHWIPSHRVYTLAAIFHYSLSY